MICSAMHQYCPGFAISSTALTLYGCKGHVQTWLAYKDINEVKKRTSVRYDAGFDGAQVLVQSTPGTQWLVRQPSRPR
jgi:hypothetical protein